MRGVDGASNAQLLVGPGALEQSAALWHGIERRDSTMPFQRHAWARAWLEHLGEGATPWIVLVDDSEHGILWPLVLRRRAGFRVLGMLGDGVSDYLGPLGDPDGARAVEALASCLRENARHYDLLDLGSLFLADAPRQALRLSLGSHSAERVYERCPVIDTSGSWEDYLATRRKKFRANLKRTERKVREHGAVELEIEKPEAGLLAELEEVERESWKWESGTAYLQRAGRRAFLRSLLLEPEVTSEIWTCRVDRELAGFAVVFTAAGARYYYLPSFRKRYSDVGTCLLREIVMHSFSSDCAEVDLLQGDESYKMAWATGERVVHELACSGRTLGGPAALAALRLRWALAGSERARRLRARLTGWRPGRSGD